MSAQNDSWAFPISVGKFITQQWSKVKSSSGSSSGKSVTNLDQLLEEEYETLLKEIDYLASERTCYLCFKNDRFNTGKSSEDLTNILKNHSEEVLRSYLAKHDRKRKKKITKNPCLHNRSDLINYVTKIVLSRPPCDAALCKCHDPRRFEEVEAVGLSAKDTKTSAPKADQRNSVLQNKDDAIANQKRLSETSEKKNNSHEQVTTEVQTDFWGQDPNCTCGCCPAADSKIKTKNDEQQLQETNISDQVITDSNNVFARCLGEAIETQTSTNKLCVPEDFESLLKANQNGFSSCPGKQDCQCDVYDVKEALKRGLVLPSSDICVQSKNGKKKKQRKSGFSDSSSSVTEWTSSNGKSSSKQTYTKIKADDDQCRPTRKYKEKQPRHTSIEYAYEITPRSQAMEKEKKKTGCFGKKKKKSLCNEECQGMINNQRAIQTDHIKTQDKSEGPNLYGEKPSAQTSTESDTAVQVSARSSKDESTSKSKQQGKEDIKDSDSSKNVKSSSKKKETKAKQSAVCNKCGRQKRGCESGCRNTIIVPYASHSGGTVAPAEAESLRMLIKMQSKDTNRQFDSIMAELNYQKSEIKRLNDMYQNMVENFYGSAKSTGNSNKKPSGLARQECCCSFKSDPKKSCGCNYSNECKMDTGKNIATTDKKGAVKISYNESNNICGESSSKTGPLKRFGPPNTAVSINMCDTCTVRISPNHEQSSSNSSQEYEAHNVVDKQRKNQVNLCRKRECDPRATGDSCPARPESLSTIYKTEKRYNAAERDDFRGAFGNLCDRNSIASYDEEEDIMPMVRLRPTVNYADADTETESSGTKKKKNTKRKYSSRVLVWLKKSWISIKHRSADCKRQEKEKPINQVFNLCQSTAKSAAAGVWKSFKKNIR